MSHISRIDPSFLRHGAIIDLNDLRTDAAIEHYKDVYFEHLPRPAGSRPAPFFTVDHLERTGPNSYEVVPQGPWNTAEARALDLLIDTRLIERVFQRGRGQLRITDHVYETLFSVGVRAVSGTTLRSHAAPIPGARPLRPNHRYVHLNALAPFVAARAVTKYPRPHCYLDHQRLFELMMASKTLHEFATPVFLEDTQKPADSAEGKQLVFVDLNLKNLDRWIRRHQSSFYQSAAKHQRVLDDMEDLLDTRHVLAQADDAKAPTELTAAEADALEIIDEEDLQEDEEAPDFNFLPTPETNQRNDEDL